MSLDNEKKKKVEAVLILEIIGKPAEHLTKTLNDLIDSMDKEQGIKVLEKDIKDVVETKERKDFFTTFAEVRVETEGIMQVLLLMFKYMPANIEIIRPENISLSNTSLSEMLSELVRKLHSYDEIARVLQMQNAQMQKKLKEILDSKKNKELDK